MNSSGWRSRQSASTGDENKEKLKRLVDGLKNATIREECWQCECFQGFIAQLETDFGELLVHAGLDEIRVEPGKVHCCLVCDPCPPPDIYAEYLRTGEQR